MDSSRAYTSEADEEERLAGNLALPPQLRLLLRSGAMSQQAPPLAYPTAISTYGVPMANPYTLPQDPLLSQLSNLVGQPQLPILQDPVTLNAMNVNAMLAAAAYEQRRREAETSSRLLALMGHQLGHHQSRLDPASAMTVSAALSMSPVPHIFSAPPPTSSNRLDDMRMEPKPPATTSFVHPVSSRSRISTNCETPEEATRTLKILGSTLRTKGDPYIDASLITDPGASVSVRGGRSEYFPDKLYSCLEETEKEGLTDICCWLPHGRAFQIRDADRFLSEVMPRFFSSLSQFSSFTRQLHLWGFGRMLSGPDVGCYFHELFLRGHPNLTGYMRRVGAPKGIDRRKVKTLEGDDPDLFSMRSLSANQDKPSE